MQRSIEIHNRNLNYTVKVSKRAKQMRIAVYCDGSCVVTVPRAFPETMLEAFLMRKSRWILDNLHYFRARIKRSRLRRAGSHILINSMVTPGTISLSRIRRPAGAAARRKAISTSITRSPSSRPKPRTTSSSTSSATSANSTIRRSSGS